MADNTYFIVQCKGRDGSDAVDYVICKPLATVARRAVHPSEAGVRRTEGSVLDYLEEQFAHPAYGDLLKAIPWPEGKPIPDGSNGVVILGTSSKQN